LSSYLGHLKSKTTSALLKGEALVSLTNKPLKYGNGMQPGILWNR